MSRAHGILQVDVRMECYDRLVKIIATADKKCDIGMRSLREILVMQNRLILDFQGGLLKSEARKQK